jgi:hypothetical protein
MATQAEVVIQLQAVTQQVVKIGAETSALLVKIDELLAQLANVPATPELTAALDALKAQAQVVDDLVPDSP